MIWISTAEHKLNTLFPIAQDLDTITKQKYDLEVTQFKYAIWQIVIPYIYNLYLY